MACQSRAKCQLSCANRLVRLVSPRNAEKRRAGVAVAASHPLPNFGAQVITVILDAELDEVSAAGASPCQLARKASVDQPVPDWSAIRPAPPPEAAGMGTSGERVWSSS